MEQPNSKSVLIVLVVVAVLGAGYFLTRPDDRTGAEHIGDAISELPNGVDKAVRELENRTPAEKIGDAVKDKTN